MADPESLDIGSGRIDPPASEPPQQTCNVCGETETRFTIREGNPTQFRPYEIAVCVGCRMEYTLQEVLQRSHDA